MPVDWTLPAEPCWVHLAVVARWEAPPDPALLLDRARAWIGTHVNPAFRDAVRTMVDRGMTTIETGPLPADLQPPRPLLEQAGAAAVARAEGADRVVAVHAPNFAGMPPWGYWVAMATAHAAALELSGVVVDPAIAFVHPVEWSAQPPRTTVPAPVSHYVNVAWSEHGSGGVLLETRGLDRLGLPELVAADIHPSLVHNARWLLLGAAWSLLRQAVQHGQGPDSSGPLVVGRLVVGAEAMLRAVGDERDVAPGTLENALGVLLAAGPDDGPRLQLLPLDNPGAGLGAVLQSFDGRSLEA